MNERYVKLSMEVDGTKYGMILNTALMGDEVAADQIGQIMRDTYLHYYCANVLTPEDAE